DHYFVELAGLRLRLPAWLAPGALTIDHADRGAGRAGRNREERKPGGGIGSVKVPTTGAVAGATSTNPPGGIDLTLPLLLLALAALAVVLVRVLRREPAATAPEEPRPPVWIPWHRSTMRGPSWNDPRPSADRTGEWSGAAAPPPEPEAQEAWTPPERRSPSHRR
ncbi:MAG: hypothetical protein J7480_10745, partial [Microbacteriaceae bacterium]|nr:hypothetical protein [Microbacteriaceae bacterium]